MAPIRLTRLPAETEAGFAAAVLAYARLCGWFAAHFRCVRVQRRDGRTYYETPVQADGRGWPDVVFVRERVVYAELKTDIGRLAPAQREWAARLTAAGQEVYTWRPRDWGTIERVLARG